jgi:hypothetical protein
MCHGIPRGQLFLRDEIAQALLDADDGDEPRDESRTVSAAEADTTGEHTPSFLAEEAAEADVLTGAMSTDGPFGGDGTSPR